MTKPENIDKPVKLTKSGKPDRRSITSKENVNKAIVVVRKAMSANRQKVEEALSKAKGMSTIPETEESDDDTDFEITPVVKPAKVEAPVIEPPVIKRVETETTDWKSQLEQEKAEREALKAERDMLKKQAEEQVSQLKLENLRLKNLGDYNNHLTRIHHLARNVNVKF